MKTLRGAVVGCGMIAEHHLRAWRAVDGVEIVALADADPARAEARRERFFPDARVYADLGALLAAGGADFLEVLTPPAAHAGHCLAGLAAGLPVICQKPLAESPDDARRLAAAAADAGLPLCVHENHRFRPWFREVLRAAAAGELGTVRYARFAQFDPREPPERYKVESTRGVLFEYGTHLLDLAHALLGEPAAVSARAFRPNPRVRGESLAAVRLEYPSATCAVEVAWKAGGPPRGEAVVAGDAGEAIYEGTMTRGERSRFRLVRGDEVVVDERRDPAADYAASFLAFDRAFAAALRGAGPFPQPAAENARVLDTTFRAYAALDAVP